MLGDDKKFATSCPECAVITGSGRVSKPPLNPIAVSRPFQILGIGIMDLPLMEQGNKHAVVMQDMFTKWPMVFAIPDQKTTRISWLSNLMTDLCRILGITKLNTTAYHSQCDGVVE